MTTLLICALVATCLPYLAKLPVAIEMNKLGGYDNKYPRNQQTRLEGLGARALAAHQNSFESLIVFAVALAVVLGTNQVTTLTESLAVTYIVARIFYCGFYYANFDKLRSLSWLVGLGCPIAMIATCF